MTGEPTPLSFARSNISGVEWPPISRGQAAELAAMVRQLDDSQWFSSQTLADLQFRQLAHVVAYAEAHSAHFRKRMADAGLKPADLTTPRGLARLPPLTRRELQSAAGMFCDAAPPDHLPVQELGTSGSTGEPVVTRRTAVNTSDWLAITVRDHLWHRRDPMGRFCAVRANIEAIGRYPYWGGPTDLLFETGPSLSVPITTALDQQIDLIAEFAPASLLTYPNNLAGLAQACEARGVAFPSLAHIRTVGESLSPQVRAEAERVFGVRVADCYSTQELGYVALECPDAPLYHVMAETLIVEVLDEAGAPCAEGQSGRLVVTDLRNFATPLIRYDIGDWAEVGPPCPCGRGLPTLKHILGRERNLILMPDGSRHWPLVGFERFREIAGVIQFQLIQDARRSIEVRLVVERPLTPDREAALGRHIQASLGFPFDLRFVYFETRLPPGANGKYENFICRVG